MGRHVLSERPSMEEGCEFEVFDIKDPRTHYFMYSIRNILEDVWYKAIVEAKPPKSPKSELCVRLLKDDFSTPLVEFTDEEVLCRSIPPKHLLDSIIITIGSIVEADYKDAWVTGFVVKEIDDDKCLVCFDSPPDIIEFERKHLRPYLEWLDEGRYTFWEVTSRHNGEFLTRLDEEPVFSPGTMVEVSSNVKKVATVSWVPAMIIKEFKDDDEYKYIAKGNEAARPNQKTVGLRSLRPTPPPFKVEEYQLMEYVEVFHGRGWQQGRVIKTLSHKKYLVLLESTKKQLVFKHSDLRPLKVWEDGVWKTMESPLTQGSGDKMCDSVMNAKESDPPVTPSPGITETPLKQTEAETQRKTFPKKILPRNQNGSGKDSTDRLAIPIACMKKKLRTKGRRARAWEKFLMNKKAQRKTFPKKILPRNQSGSGEDLTDRLAIPIACMKKKLRTKGRRARAWEKFLMNKKVQSAK